MTEASSSSGNEPSASREITFELPAKVEFGPGRIGVLERLIDESGFERAAFIMTPGRRRSGMFDPILARLEANGVDTLVFDRIASNPTLASVARCTRALQRFAPHVIVGIGGGSTLDTAKASAACVANRLESAVDLLDEDRTKRRSVPTILIPTTAGTGTEVNYWAVITDEEKREKLSIGNPKMAPYMAIIDPSLALSLPPDLTLWSGVDALTHAIEAFISASGNWLSDMFCLGAISLITEWLGYAIIQGDDLSARGSLALASLLAGAAMGNVGLGLVHAISHQIGGFYGAPHGQINAALLPHVLEFNEPACEAKISTLDGLVREAGTLKAWLGWFLQEHSPMQLSLRIQAVDVPEMAARAASNVNAQTNPRKATEEEITELFRRAFTVI
ncbi:MAG: iron-containing alcohol dehydrogenase [Candidatus Bipolaricaulia bacterium]